MANGRKMNEVDIMIGCPEDAEVFISAVKAGIESFNKNHGNEYKVNLIGKHYKDDTYSAQGNPQDVINKQLCDSCKLLIAVFYLSAGSANASFETGTFAEIDYFRKNNKNAFVFEYKGSAQIDMRDQQQLKKFDQLIKALDENKKKILFTEYEDDDGLTEEVEKQLLTYYKSIKQAKRGAKQKDKKVSVSEGKNELQMHMYFHMKQFDNRNLIGERFSFHSKSQSLIEGIKEDGSVQYYIGKKERYRTTPTASVLEALYLGDLIPCSVCHKMQDWVYSSKEDPCDEPDESNNGKRGHKPDECDKYGWSWNEGVSVWATSKALNTLIETGYYSRPEIRSNTEICTVTREALSWLANQAYEDGGWGFQKIEGSQACAASVTMTALTLTAITRFLNAADKQNGLTLDNDLEKRLSEAKQKGIQYLIKTKIEDNDKIYWKYNDKPSLTGTVWVLDFINIGQRSETGELYSLKDKIIKFCLDKLPRTEREFDHYQDEVYFTGGKTKYKDIPRNSKFYSYMPYHIVVLLKAGVDPDDEHIVTCIRGLIMGKEDYWKGTDRSAGAHQRASCFVTAMALGVIADWLRWKRLKLIELKK